MTSAYDPRFPRGLGNEARLVQALVSHPDADDWEARVGELLEPELDWRRLAYLITRNRVLTLVDARLRSFSEHLPDVLAQELSRVSRWHALRGAGIRLELRRVLEALSSAEILAVPYKGAVVAELYYDDPSLRQYKDIDILVRRADIERADQVLRDLGYRAVEERSRGRHLARDCQFHYWLDDSIEVELHWRFLPRRQSNGLEADPVWSRLQTVDVDGMEVQTFSHEDALFVLAVHGGEKHRWQRLLWLCDIAYLLQLHQELDWSHVFSWASETKRERTILLAAYLAWLVLRAPVDPDVLARAVADPWVCAHAAMLRDESGLPTYTEWRAFHSDGTRVIRERGLNGAASAGAWRYLATVLHPQDDDYAVLSVPPGFDFLYWLVRPLRLVKSHPRGFLRRLTRRPLRRL